MDPRDTIDPFTRQLLAMMAASPLPKLHQLTAQAARAQAEAGMTSLDMTGVPIGAVRDLSVAGGAGPLAARLYRAAGAEPGPTGLLVFFHGGGFVIGSIDTHDSICRTLANDSGQQVLSVAYRLAPETVFPGAVEDAVAATTWAADNAGSLGVDPRRIAVGGDSAGGNLAAVVAQIARDRGAPHLAFQLLLYPYVGTRGQSRSATAFDQGYLLDAETMRWFNDQYLGGRTVLDDPRLSPILAADLSGLPPAYVMTAGLDPLRDDGRHYAELLASAGVPAQHVCHEGMVHGFLNMGGVLPRARVALSEAARALGRAIG